MLRLISTITVAVLTAISMSTTDVQAGKLPASVSSQLQIATGPDQIALLAIAYPKLSASIMEEAAALGVSTPAQVISAAVTSDASPAIIVETPADTPAFPYSTRFKPPSHVTHFPDR